jgi:hypothetical protein
MMWRGYDGTCMLRRGYDVVIVCYDVAMTRLSIRAGKVTYYDVALALPCWPCDMGAITPVDYEGVGVVSFGFAGQGSAG